MKLVTDLSPTSLPWRPRRAPPPPALSLDFAAGRYAPGTFGDLVVFTRGSAASYFDAAGGLQSAAADAPRFDHDPATGAPLGLLIEESRTNVLLGSDAPATQAVTVAASAYTLSFYGTGTVSLSGAFSGGLTGTAGFPVRSTLSFVPAAGSLTLSMTGDVQFAQLEPGGFASSYISTAAAAVTRAADVAHHTLGAEWTAGGGTVVADFRPQPVAQHAIAAYFNSTSFQESFGIMKSNSVNTGPGDYITGAVYAGGSAKLTLAQVGNDGAFHKVALGFDNAVLTGCTDGGAVMTVANAQMPAPSKLNIGQRDGNALPLNGHVRSVRYFAGRLSDADMQEVTA